MDLSSLQQLNNNIVESSPDSYLVDTIIPGAPLIITFGFACWDSMPKFDFFGRIRKLHALTGENINLILIRDIHNAWYHRGTDGLGNDVDETTVSLDRIIKKILPSKIITIGQSMGAYAAIMFGCLLSADQVIAFGSLSFLATTRAHKMGDLRWIKVMEDLEINPPRVLYSNLTELCRFHPKTVIHLVYGRKRYDQESVNFDHQHAGNLAGLNNVYLHSHPESGHAIVQYLIDTNQIDAFLLKIIFNPEVITNTQQGLSVIPNGWRMWIAECIIQNVPIDRMRSILINESFNPIDIEQEINNAMDHPYISVGKKYSVITGRREWMLSTLDKLVRCGENNQNIQRITPPPLDVFLQEYYYKNKPVIFTEAIDHWPAKNWTPDYIKNQLGHINVEVQFGRTNDVRYEQNGAKYKKIIQLSEYINLVQNSGSSNDLYMAANNSNINNPLLSELFAEIGDFGKGYLDHELNSTQGFLWIGPEGTITPLHHDLTNNLFVQVYGKKKFSLISSLQVPLLYNHDHVYSDVDLLNPDSSKFPDFDKASVISFELNPGEALFIPIGWWHHVVALSTSISLSFTNFNAPTDFGGTYPV